MPNMAKPYLQGKSPRQDAIKLGKHNYFSNRPCPLGHIGMKRVTGACLDCIRINRPIQNQRRIKKDPLIFSYIDAKRRAKKHGIEFNIEKTNINIRTECPLLGIKLVYGNIGSPNGNSASIDRIDSSKGYIRGNVWIISDRANRIKRDASFEEFEKIYLGWKKKLNDTS